MYSALHTPTYVIHTCTCTMNDAGLKASSVSAVGEVSGLARRLDFSPNGKSGQEQEKNSSFSTGAANDY